MARLLSQLRCAGCRARFWPDLAAAGSLVIVCPHCGVAHANLGARTWMPIPAGWAIPSLALVPAIQWLEANWLGDDVPVVDDYLTPLTGVRRLQPFEHRGCPGCVFWCRNPDASVPSWALVTLLPPPGRPSLRAGGYTAHWSGAGLWIATRASADSLGSAACAIVDQALALGGAPLSPLEGVPDPQPLDPDRESQALAADPDRDAALAARSIECPGCGAPVSVVELSGRGRCPYCGLQQRLPPELAQELALFQRRMHAALLRAPTLAVGGLRMAGGGGDSIAVMCVQCGAPGRIRAGALEGACGSCSAPLVPSRQAMARGVDIGAQAADRVARTRAADRAQVSMDRGAEVNLVAWGAIALFGLNILAAIAFASFVAVGAAIQNGVSAWVSVPPAVLVNLGALGVLGLIGYWVYARSREKAARWRSRFTTLASQLGGQWSAQPKTLLQWAERWWSDRIAPDWLAAGRSRMVLFAQLAGFPVAITVQIEGVLTIPWLAAPGRPHAAILIAARLPRDAAYWAARPEIKQLTAELERAGYALELRTGGIALCASARLVAQFREQPDHIATLAPIAFALARLPHHLRAEPPPGPT